MGNSGLVRFFNPGDVVETQYNSIYEIPLMTLDRTEETLEKYKGKKLLFLVFAPRSILLETELKQIEVLRNHLAANGTQVIGISTNAFQGKTMSFEELKKFDLGFPVYPAVELNGSHSHPLMRYLKRRSPLYNKKLLFGRPIMQEISKFYYDGKQDSVEFFGTDTTVGQIFMNKTAES